MNRYKFYIIFLFIVVIYFTFIAQQINPPRLLNVKVYDYLGLPISFAVISFDFKVVGLTNQNGELTFENKGGLLSISKNGYISKIIQIPNYWQGRLNINLSKIKNAYENKVEENKNYKITIYYNNSPLIKEKVLVLKESSILKTYYTNENGVLELNFKKNSEVYLIYITNKQNNLYIYFSRLKESDNDSLVMLNYNVYDYLLVDLKDNIIVDNVIIKNTNFAINIPIAKKFNLVMPYRIYFGSNDYDFFYKYELFFNFLLPYSFYAKSISSNDIVQNTLISMMINYKESKILTNELFKSIINSNIKNFDIIDFFNDFNNRCKYNFTNEGFFEFSYKKGKVDFLRLRLYDSNKDLIIEGYFSTYIKIPKIFFEKDYTLIVEFYPTLFYDTLLINEILLSKNSYYGVIIKLP